MKALRRLEKRKLAICHLASNPYEPNLWSRPGIKPVSPEFRAHEVACADLFVAYYGTPGLTHWDWQWTKAEVDEYATFRKSSFLFDRRMILNGRMIFFEHDRGNRHPEKLAEQIKNYYDFSVRYPDLAMNVIYTLDWARAGLRYDEDTKLEYLNERGRFLEQEFKQYRRGNQFLFALQSDVVADPLGKVFVSPLTDARLSLSDL